MVAYRCQAQNHVQADAHRTGYANVCATCNKVFSSRHYLEKHCIRRGHRAHDLEPEKKKEALEQQRGLHAHGEHPILSHEDENSDKHSRPLAHHPPGLMEELRTGSSPKLVRHRGNTQRGVEAPASDVDFARTPFHWHHSILEPNSCHGGFAVSRGRGASGREKLALLVWMSSTLPATCPST